MRRSSFPTVWWALRRRGVDIAAIEQLCVEVAQDVEEPAT
jgi:hypothetical protein